MNRSLKRKLLVGTAVAAVLTGGALAAVTAAGEGPLGHRHGHSHGDDARPSAHRGGRSDVAIAAGYLGLSTAQLHAELRSGKTLAEIANATGGKSEAGLIEALVAAKKAALAALATTLPQRVSREVNRGGGPGHRSSPAADYLGLRAAQLHSELGSGKTLAQIADAANGKSVTGLIEALVAAGKARLAAQVSDGTLTRAQANAIQARLHSRASARVNRARSPHGAVRSSLREGARE